MLGSFVLHFIDLSVSALGDVVDDIVVFEGYTVLVHHHGLHFYDKYS